MQVAKRIMSFGLAILVVASASLPACAQSEKKPETDQLIQANVSVGEKRFPQVEIAHFFAPPGESNVRSSFKLADGIALMGTEETGDVFKTTDGGKTWRKTVDGGEEWSIQDIRNYIRADDGRIYATTSEPALVLCSDDEGESFEIVARAKRGVFVIDRVVQEEIGGGVDLDNDRWFIPDTGKMIVPGTKR